MQGACFADVAILQKLNPLDNVLTLQSFVGVITSGFAFFAFQCDQFSCIFCHIIPWITILLNFMWSHLSDLDPTSSTWLRGAGRRLPIFADRLEPIVGFEPTTFALQKRCSTTELYRRSATGEKQLRHLSTVALAKVDHWAKVAFRFTQVKPSSLHRAKRDGAGSRIRTYEGEAAWFTVRCSWPLCYPSMKYRRPNPITSEL